MRHTKPLWVPLKAKYFDAFEAGSKTIEYRLYGAQWTEKHIYPGRPAVLGRGYSGRRLRAEVIKLEVRVMSTETYGPNRRLALIHLRLLDVAASQRTGSRAPTSPNP